jgi:hypothetical protein
MADEVAVEENMRVAESAIQFQPEAFVAVFRREREGAAIPTDVIGSEAGANRFKTVAQIGILVEGQFDGPIVRKVQRAPGAVVESGRGRAGALAGFAEAFGDAPLVAQMEFPAEVHEQPLARGIVGRLGGGGRKCRMQNAECRKQDERDRFWFHHAAGSWVQARS